MGVRAGKSNAVATKSGEFYDRTDDFVGPLGIEPDGVDVGNDGRLFACGKQKGPGIERHVSTQTSLMGLGSPTPLGRAGGGSKVGSPGAGPKRAHFPTPIKRVATLKMPRSGANIIYVGNICNINKAHIYL